MHNINAMAHCIYDSLIGHHIRYRGVMPSSWKSCRMIFAVASQSRSLESSYSEPET